jgi:hypothetical protein
MSKLIYRIEIKTSNGTRIVKPYTEACDEAELTASILTSIMYAMKDQSMPFNAVESIKITKNYKFMKGSVYNGKF